MCIRDSYQITDNGQYFQIFLNPDGTEKEGAFWSSEEGGEPELYTGDEMYAVDQHIKRYFGEFYNVFHELVSPDIHVDICIVPVSYTQLPSNGRLSAHVSHWCRSTGNSSCR